MRKYLFLSLLMAATLLSCTKQNRPITVWMIGDSTMADRYDTIETPERGWGQVFPTFLSDDVRVMNHAKNGRSTKSFLAEGRFEPVMEGIAEGDVVIIQFGHNDAKMSDSTRFASPTDYAANLTLMVRAAKAKGANVILCTPIARRHFKNDTLQYVHGDYPVRARDVAQAEEVPLVDMTTLTMDWLAPLGDNGSRQFFVYEMKPGEYSKYPEGKTDNTHLRLAGAVQVARMFASQVAADKIMPLADYVKPLNTDIKYTTPCGIK